MIVMYSKLNICFLNCPIVTNNGKMEKRTLRRKMEMQKKTRKLVQFRECIHSVKGRKTQSNTPKSNL